MRTATTLGFLRLSGLLLFRRLLRLDDRLVLDNLGNGPILLSHSTTEAFLLGAALRITLSASAKDASARLGGKGTHDMLIEQLVGIDMLTRGSFFRSGHLNGILNRLLLGIIHLGIDGIERRAPLMPLPSILVTIFAAISSSRIALVSHSLSTERKICASALDLILSALRQSRS